MEVVQMNLQEFRELNNDDKKELIIQNLNMLKEKGVSVSAHFRDGELDFTYTSAAKEMESIGYRISRYDLVKIEETKTMPEIEMDNNYLFHYLTTEYADLQESRKNQPDGEKPKGTSVKIYPDTFKEFKELCQHYKMFREYTLLDAVIREGLKKFI